MSDLTTPHSGKDLPKSRRLRFSLRTLLLLVLLMAAVFSWLGSQYRMYSQEQRIATMIRSVGGEVTFSNRIWIFQKVDSVDLTLKPGDPKLHPDLFRDLLRQLSRLTQLSSVDLDGTQFSNEDLVHLKQCKHLQQLNLTNTTITDQGLVHLYDLPKLEEVELGQTAVTEQGVSKISQSRPDLLILDD